MFAILLAIWICVPAGAHYPSRSGPKHESKPLRQPKSPTAPQHLQSDFSATFEADRHYRSMLTKTKCKEPLPVVVDVKEQHHSATVDYLPHCTILHRCEAKAGCCGKGRHCTWATRSYVDLYFYAIPLNTNHSGSDIMKLTFTNHTSCACKEDIEVNEVNLEKTTETPWEAGDDKDDYVDGFLGCKKCPSPFAERILGDSQCSCDCFDGERECVEIKKGHRTLSSQGTSCVRHEECQTPSCYTGSFDIPRGICPRVCQPGTVFDHRKRRCILKHHRHKQRYTHHATT